MQLPIGNGAFPVVSTLYLCSALASGSSLGTIQRNNVSHGVLSLGPITSRRLLLKRKKVPARREEILVWKRLRTTVLTSTILNNLSVNSSGIRY